MSATVDVDVPDDADDDLVAQASSAASRSSSNFTFLLPLIAAAIAGRAAWKKILFRISSVSEETLEFQAKLHRSLVSHARYCQEGVELLLHGRLERPAQLTTHLVVRI